MKYFDKDFLDFFIELAANNHKDWFDENRKRYEKSVKNPFKAFVADLIIETSKLDSDVQIEAKDAIFRINRDIRFSKDKTPYKTNVSAIISKVGRKDHSVPGFYVDFGPEKLWMGGGAYFLPTDKLAKLRQAIATDTARFKKLIADKKFNQLFTEGIQGEENKRAPKEFKEASEKFPMLLKKQFYYMAELKPETLLSDELMSITLEHYKAALPIQNYLKQSVV